MNTRVVAVVLGVFLNSVPVGPAFAACPTLANIAGDWVIYGDGALTSLTNLAESIPAAGIGYRQILPTGRYREFVAFGSAGSYYVERDSGRLKVLSNCLIRSTKTDSVTGVQSTTYLAVINNNKMVEFGSVIDDLGGLGGHTLSILERAQYSPF